MSSPREHRYSLDITFFASPGEADDMLQDIVDSIDFAGGDVEVSPYSSNPTLEECECCGDECWEDELESCQGCGAAICGGCMIHYNGFCGMCDEDPDSNTVD